MSGPLYTKPKQDRRGDHLCTPPDVVQLVRNVGRGRIALDPCSNRWSIVGAEVELRRGGLEADWRRLARGGLVYWNCPYSGGQIARWWDKARREAERGVEHLGLLHCDTSTAWYRDVLRHAAAVGYPPRINFIDRGRILRGNQYAQLLVYQGEHHYRFVDECERLWAERVLTLRITGCGGGYGVWASRRGRRAA